MNDNFPTLQQGSTGPDVIRLQDRLNQLSYYSGAIDGDFGPGTKQAVINFQQARGLIADGIVGPSTWSQINRVLCSNYAQYKWQRMTQSQEVEEIQSLTNSPVGIGALNQLALERFVGINCTRSYYVSKEFGNNLTLMRVKCDPPGGISTAIGYHEVRVTFSRYEGNLERYDIAERLHEESGPPLIQLPD